MVTMSDEPTPSHWDRKRTIRVGEYERIAMQLFARHGYPNVTVDDIAAAAEVSARTLFRYFPTKEDFLLGYARRTVADMVERIDALETDPDPLRTAWAAIRAVYLEAPPHPEVLNLWRRAAAEAPEVVARATGERTRMVLDAVTAYCARSLGLDAIDDARPRIMAGRLVGVELAMIEAVGRSTLGWADVLDVAERSVLMRSVPEALLPDK
jgi:AcrR family transcriptional regulator